MLDLKQSKYYLYLIKNVKNDVVISRNKPKDNDPNFLSYIVFASLNVLEKFEKVFNQSNFKDNKVYIYQDEKDQVKKEKNEKKQDLWYQLSIEYNHLLI